MSQHEDFKTLLLDLYAGQEQQEVLATSPDGQRQILATHYKVDGATPSLQYEQIYFSIKLNAGKKSSGGADALYIGIKAYSSGKEEQSINLGVYNKEYPEYVTNYNWTNNNDGCLSPVYSKTGISSETLKILKDSGIAVISKEVELPDQINVEAAVDYWFAEIRNLIRNPQRLTNTDLSVSGTISPFEI